MYDLDVHAWIEVRAQAEKRYLRIAFLWMRHVWEWGKMPWAS